MAKMYVIAEGLHGRSFGLDGEYFTIGREPDNAICLDHTSVSKHHAMVTVENGDFKLWDLHSTNGVIVNGQPTVLSHLKDGDKIVLGEIELRFELNHKRATQVPAFQPQSSPTAAGDGSSPPRRRHDATGC